MATQTDFAITNQWQNITAALTAAASVDAVYQCVSQDTIQIVKGGATAPTGKTGLLLDFKDSVQLNDANVWVRCFDGDGATVSVTVL